MAIPECVPIKEVEMRKHVLVLTTAAAILGYGAIAASAQPPGAQTPSTQQSSTPQVTPSGSMQQQDQTQLQRRARLREPFNLSFRGFARLRVRYPRPTF